jgi:hypothetical protein
MLALIFLGFVFAWILIGYIFGCLIERQYKVSDDDFLMLSVSYGPFAFFLWLILLGSAEEKKTISKPSKLRRWIRGF